MKNPLRRTRSDSKSSYSAQKDAMQAPEPTTFIIFGVTGNLARTRLLPALYHLLKDNLLHKDTVIIGISRRELSADELINEVELCVLENDKACDPVVLQEFKQHLRTFRLDPLKATDYRRLGSELDSIETEKGMCMSRLFYLSIPPQVYEPVIENLGRSGLSKGCNHPGGQTRLLVEKPFGYDLSSATELIESTKRYFMEEQLFRIDHYLAKETVQNILVFRKHNPLFADLWSSRCVSAINLIFHEQIGINGRGEFYDNIGALRDVVQNHLMQLLTLATLELPASLHDSNALHRAKEQLLTSIKPVDLRTAGVQRGQYRGYRDEVSKPRSTTETFTSLSLAIDNKRWQGVPVHISAGKALKAKQVSLTMVFGSESAGTNALTFRIQPNEGIDVEVAAKRPGFESAIERVHMDFSYRGVFAEPEHPDAYERVLVDAIKGDHTLFATSREVLESWRILQPILDAWEIRANDLFTYERGTDDPVVESTEQADVKTKT